MKACTGGMEMLARLYPHAFGTNSTIPPLIHAGRERCTSVPPHCHAFPKAAADSSVDELRAYGCMVRKTESESPLPHETPARPI
jgi:hypothetical protein